jgi:hypothetical protein
LGTGPLAEFSQILKQSGFQEGQAPQLTVPHVHSYHEFHDDAEMKIMNHFNWVRTPLSSDELQS